MHNSRRTEILMDPDEYRLLRDLARRERTSLSELIRTAVRMTYLEPKQGDKRAAIGAILQLKLPAVSWRRALREIEADRVRSLVAPERLYVKGYRRKPEDPAVGKLGEKLAAEVWPKENWDDHWESGLSPQLTRRRKVLSR